MKGQSPKSQKTYYKGSGHGALKPTKMSLHFHNFLWIPIVGKLNFPSAAAGNDAVFIKLN